MILVHGNRLIAHQVFQLFDLRSFNKPDVDMTPLIESAEALTTRVAGEVPPMVDKLYPESYLASLFKNLTKCKAIDQTLIESRSGAEEDSQLEFGV